MDALMERQELEQENNSRGPRPQYTQENDQLIITRITAAKAAGADMTAVMMALADEIGRPLSGVKGRWNRLKKDLEDESGSGDQASGLIKKLRNIRADREEMERQRDAYKLRAEKAEAQVKKVEKDLNALKQKYEALVAEVAAIVG